MNQALPKRAQFHHMKDGTQEDWEIIGAEFFEFRGDVCKRIKAHLMLLEGDCGGFAIDRLTHSLQTAPWHTETGKMKNMWCAPCCTTLVTRWALPTMLMLRLCCSSPT